MDRDVVLAARPLTSLDEKSMITNDGDLAQHQHRRGDSGLLAEIVVIAAEEPCRFAGRKCGGWGRWARLAA